MEGLASAHANLPVCSENDAHCWQQQEETKIDPYEVLGVSRFGSQEEIKHAYRALAMLHHPDKVGINTANEADAETFKDLGQANALIGTRDKRVAFDASERIEKGYYWLYPEYITEIQTAADFEEIQRKCAEAHTARAEAPGCVLLVQFYSSHCGACSDAREYMIETAKQVGTAQQKGEAALADVKVLTVKCESGGTNILCSQQRIEFYPTYRLLLPGQRYDYFGSDEYNAPIDPPARQHMHFEKYQPRRLLKFARRVMNAQQLSDKQVSASEESAPSGDTSTAAAGQLPSADESGMYTLQTLSSSASFGLVTKVKAREKYQGQQSKAPPHKALPWLVLFTIASGNSTCDLCAAASRLWRRYAGNLSRSGLLHSGVLDCGAEQGLCQSHIPHFALRADAANVRGVPSFILFPGSGRGGGRPLLSRPFASSDEIQVALEAAEAAFGFGATAGTSR
jgi:curved DNA-binding protein CbpA